MSENDSTVLPLNADFTSFQVFFSLQGKHYSFALQNVPSPKDAGKMSLAEAKIQCEPQLELLFRGFEHILQQRLSQSTDVAAFVLEVKDIMERVIRAQPDGSLLPDSFYARLFSEIEDIGWENISFIDDDATALRFRIVDVVGRQHSIRVDLQPGYPQETPSVSADLPKVLELNWFPGAGLKHIVSQCKNAIDSFQDFWTVMEDIDRKAWVLEPIHPSRAIAYRRIALGGHCSFSIIVDASSPRTLPEYRFFGSKSTVAPLRMRINTNLSRWKNDKLLLENFEAVLELALPSRQDVGNEDLSADCGICYAYFIPHGSDSDGGASRPDRICENVNCGRTFHGVCLVEWLRSLTTTRQSFDVLFGHCPYCSHPIAVKNSV